MQLSRSLVRDVPVEPVRGNRMALRAQVRFLFRLPHDTRVRRCYAISDGNWDIE